MKMFFLSYVNKTMYLLWNLPFFFFIFYFLFYFIFKLYNIVLVLPPFFKSIPPKANFFFFPLKS